MQEIGKVDWFKAIHIRNGIMLDSFFLARMRMMYSPMRFLSPRVVLRRISIAFYNFLISITWAVGIVIHVVYKWKSFLHQVYIFRGEKLKQRQIGTVADRKCLQQCQPIFV